MDARILFYISQQVYIAPDNDKEQRIEPKHDKTNKMNYVPSKDSDQPGHLPSLISLHCELHM